MASLQKSLVTSGAGGGQGALGGGAGFVTRADAVAAGTGAALAELAAVAPISECAGGGGWAPLLA